jgi:hypothetical protein
MLKICYLNDVEDQQKKKAGMDVRNVNDKFSNAERVYFHPKRPRL